MILASDGRLLVDHLSIMAILNQVDELGVILLVVVIFVHFNVVFFAWVQLAILFHLLVYLCHVVMVR